MSDLEKTYLCTTRLEKQIYTHIQYPIGVFTWYNFTSYLILLPFYFILRYLTGAYFVLGMNLFLLLLHKHILDSINE